MSTSWGDYASYLLSKQRWASKMTKDVVASCQRRNSVEFWEWILSLNNFMFGYLLYHISTKAIWHDILYSTLSIQPHSIIAEPRHTYNIHVACMLLRQFNHLRHYTVSITSWRSSTIAYFSLCNQFSTYTQCCWITEPLANIMYFQLWTALTLSQIVIRDSGLEFIVTTLAWVNSLCTHYMGNIHVRLERAYINSCVLT